MTAPSPPADLADRVPNILALAAGTVVHRFYTAVYDPIYFDRTRSGRLNSSNGLYGVLYSAKEPYGAFAETFLRTPGRRLIDPDLLARKAYARLRIECPLRLVEMHGPGLGILGATAEVVHGGLPYDVPQAWSDGLHAHPVAADGIAYNARHDDTALCYALFDHDPVPVVEIDRETDLDVNWFWELAERYKMGRAP